MRYYRIILGLSENFFNGLEKVGLGMLSGMDIYESEEEKTEKEEKKQVEKVSEDDYLFDKAYECPVCGENFKSKTVKANRAKLVGTDMDLRPRYQGIDIVKYDCITCKKCGYSALTRYFNHLSDMQVKLVKTNITPNFKGLEEPGEIYTYEEAYIRYQLALANAVITKAKMSEKAYICLKCAWILRGMREILPKNATNRKAIVEQYKAEEKKYLQKAYEGFSTAAFKEHYPICGMDTGTMTYLLAALAIEVDDHTNAMRYVSEVIASKGTSERTKEKARELREMIKK